MNAVLSREVCCCVACPGRPAAHFLVREHSRGCGYEEVETENTPDCAERRHCEDAKRICFGRGVAKMLACEHACPWSTALHHTQAKHLQRMVTREIWHPGPDWLTSCSLGWKLV